MARRKDNRPPLKPLTTEDEEALGDNLQGLQHIGEVGRIDHDDLLAWIDEQRKNDKS